MAIRFPEHIDGTHPPRVKLSRFVSDANVDDVNDVNLTTIMILSFNDREQNEVTLNVVLRQRIRAEPNVDMLNMTPMKSRAIGQVRLPSAGALAAARMELQPERVRAPSV